MRARWGLGVAGTVAVVLLAIWVTSAQKVAYLESGPADGANPTPAAPTSPGGQGSEGSLEEREPPRLEIPEWIWAISTVLLSLFALALLTLVVHVELRRRRRRAARRATDADSAAVDSDYADSMVAQGLAEAASDQRPLLLEGPPRNAIVACWLALEEAAEAGGIRRRPAETSLEFTRRVVEEQVVDESAIHRLAELYREARFSLHELDESHRSAALAALDEIVDDLAARHPAPTGAHA